jgi:hypothetical protein
MAGRAYLPLLGVGLLGTLGILLHAGEPGRLSWWTGGGIVFTVWAAAPYGVMALAGRSFRSAPRAMRTLWIGALLVVVASLALLWQSFVVDPDAQAGLVLVALPFWQIVLFLPFLVVAAVLRSRARDGPR